MVEHKRHALAVTIDSADPLAKPETNSSKDSNKALTRTVRLMSP
jgi:hypothetical protein